MCPCLTCCSGKESHEELVGRGRDGICCTRDRVIQGTIRHGEGVQQLFSRLILGNVITEG